MYLDKAILANTTSTLRKITERIRRAAEDVQFHEGTVERVLQDYAAAQDAKQIRGPPWLYEVSPQLWYFGSERA